MQAHRIREVEELLRGHLYPDEAFRVVWESGELTVVPGEGEEARLPDDPDFHGQLLSLNERISDAGSLLALFGLGGTLFVILAIAFDAFPNVTGSLDILRAWWFYVVAAVAGLALTTSLTSLRERAVFRRAASELDDGLERHGLSRYALLSIINDDDDLSSLVEMLKSTAPSRP